MDLNSEHSGIALAHQLANVFIEEIPEQKYYLFSSKFVIQETPFGSSRICSVRDEVDYPKQSSFQVERQ